MKRREFMTLLGGAAAMLPLAANAQQPTIPVIGFLGAGSFSEYAVRLGAFRRGLHEAGYAEGENVAIEYRWAEAHMDRLPALAADLVRRRVAVIATTGNAPALVAKEATSTIPIVFAIADDPVRYGLVTSLGRPGGSVTGMTFLSAELTGKRLNLLLELIPQATTIAYLSGPSDSPIFEDRKDDMLAAGRALGRKIIVSEVRRFDFEAAFATVVEQRADALIIGDFTVFLNPGNRDKILELAARHKIPAMYPNRAYAVHGGLMSYNHSELVVVIRQLGSHYVARILKGAKPSDLPVMQPTKFELIINHKTAKALGIDVPDKLLALADVVIE